MSQWITSLAALAQESAPKGPQGGLGQLLIPIALIMVLYVFMIGRPKKKEEEARRRKIESAQKGDRVMTIGGIHGKVADVDTQHKTMTIEVAPKVLIKFSQSAIASVEPKNAPQDADDKEQAKG